MPTPRMYPGDYIIDGLLYGSDSARMVADEIGAEILRDALDLTQEFSSIQPWLVMLNAYYRGRPTPPRNPERMSVRYAALAQMSVSNWCSLVVDVVNERLRVDSIRSAESPIRDEIAWDWWQANNMDQVSSMVHVEALVFGYAYVSVWPGCASCPDPTTPTIMGESPLSTYAAFDMASGECLHAIRMWFDRPTGRIFADYTTPEFQFGLMSTGEIERRPYTWGWHHDSSMWSYDFANASWTWRTVDGTPMVQANPMGVVPYVRMRTKPDLLGGYTSEIESLLPVQDRINQTTFDRLLAQEFAAFPQRWVTGIDIPVDPVTGKPREPWDAAVDRVWTMDNPDGKFGQFDAANIEGYLNANTADIQALATQSRTPPHYLVAGQAVFPSGESVRATEYGLSRKVSSRQQSYGDSWGDVLRLCGRAAGDARLAEDHRLTVGWADVEAHSEAESADALLKLSQVPGVPTAAVAVEAGQLVAPELPIVAEAVQQLQTDKSLVSKTLNQPTKIPVPAVAPQKPPA